MLDQASTWLWFSLFFSWVIVIFPYHGRIMFSASNWILYIGWTCPSFCMNPQQRNVSCEYGKIFTQKKRKIVPSKWFTCKSKRGHLYLVPDLSYLKLQLDKWYLQSWSAQASRILLKEVSKYGIHMKKKN